MTSESDSVVVAPGGLLRPVFGAVFVTMMLATLVLLESPPTGDQALRQAALVAIVSCLLGWYGIARSSPLGAWSGAWWYVAVLALFHLGAAVPYALGTSLPAEMEDYLRSWLGPTSPRVAAVLLSALAVQAFSFGVLLGGRKPRVTSSEPTFSEKPRAGTAMPGAAAVGILLVGGGMLWIFLYIMSVNPDLLLGSGGRDTFWDALAGGGVLDIASFAIAFGGILLLLAPRKRVLRAAGLLLLCAFLLWALLVGARTLSMYTIATLVVVAARRRRMPSARVALILVVLGLSTVALVGSVRGAGVAEVRISDVSANPLRGVAEMGGSLRPLVVNMTLAAEQAEPPRDGVTYLGFGIRQVESVAGVWRQPGDTDPRLAGTELRINGFPELEIGYSSIAEAFLNWRVPGVVAIFLLQGWVLGRLDNNWRRGTQSDYVAGSIFFLLVFMVRQPSTMAVPILLMATVAYVLAATLSVRGVPRRRPGLQGGPYPSTLVHGPRG